MTEINGAYEGLTKVLDILNLKLAEYRVENGVSSTLKAVYANMDKVGQAIDTLGVNLSTLQHAQGR